MKVLITGADGFIGKHACLHFKHVRNYDVIPVNREQFNDDKYLLKCVKESDIIFHAAGVNEGKDTYVFTTNVEIAYKLKVAILKSNGNKQVFNCNTYQREMKNSFGKSKYNAELILNTLEKENSIHHLVMHDVFGEGANPSNNILAKMCIDVSYDKSVNIIDNKGKTLTYIGDIFENCDRVILAKINGKKHLYRNLNISCFRQTPKEIMTTLHHLKIDIESGVLPEYRYFSFYLYKTLLYYYPKDKLVRSKNKTTDDRGDLSELVMSYRESLVFISNSNPGMIRGNHYHTKKLERIHMINGVGTINLKNMLTGDITKLKINSDNWDYIDIPCYYSHNIVNETDDVNMSLFWTNQHYDKDNDDTYSYVIESI